MPHTLVLKGSFETLSSSATLDLIYESDKKENSLRQSHDVVSEQDQNINDCSKRTTETGSHSRLQGKMNSTHVLVYIFDNLESGSHDDDEDTESDQDQNDSENLKAGLSAFFLGVCWPLQHHENDLRRNRRLTFDGSANPAG